MSKLIIPFSFERQNKEPLEVDYKVETLTDLETLKSKKTTYEGQQAYCVEDSTLYIYNKLGKFEPVGSGSIVDVIEKDNINPISSKGVYNGLYVEKTQIVIDTPAYYSVCQSTDTGALNVVTVVTDGATQILLNDINTQTTPEDLSTLTGDGTEYVKHIAEVNHEETHDEEKYMLKDNTYDKETIDKKIVQIGNVTVEKGTTDTEYLIFVAQKGTADESKVSFTKEELRGLGIKSIAKNSDGDTIVTYTDNTTQNIGQWNGKNATINVKDNTDYKYTLEISYYDKDNNLVTFATPNLKTNKIEIVQNTNNTENSYKLDINTYDEEGNKTTVTSDELMAEKYAISPKLTNNKYDYRLDIEKTKNDGTKEIKTTSNLKGNEIWEGKDLIGNEIVFEVVTDDGKSYSRVNDLYINTNTNDIYRRTDKGNVNNLWEKVGNIQGKEGNDAYEVAVEEGFKGTRQEWLKSLMGESLGSQIVWEKPNIHDENTMLKVWYYYKVDVLKYGNGSAWLNRYNIPTNKDYKPGTYSFYNGINYLTFTSTRGDIPAKTEKYATQFYVLYDEKNSQVKLYAENRETKENSVLSDWMEITKSSIKPEGSELVYPAGDIIQYGTWVQTIYLGNSKENAYDCTITTGADVSGFVTTEEFKSSIGSDDLKTDSTKVRSAINEIFDMVKANKNTVLETVNKSLFEAVNELYKKKYMDCYELKDEDLLAHCLNLQYKPLSCNFIYAENCTNVPQGNNGYGYAMLIISQDTHYRQVVFFDPANGKISTNNIGDNADKTSFGNWSGWNSASDHITTHASDTDIHVTTSDKEKWNGYNDTINEMKTNFQGGVNTIYDSVVAKGVTPVDKSPSEIADAISKLGGDLTSIYNALTNKGLPISGAESDEQIASIITDLMTIKSFTTRTDSTTFVFNGTKDTIKDTELLDTSSGLILEFNKEELTSVELGGYIEFAEIDKTEYNNKLKFM